MKKSHHLSTALISTILAFALGCAPDGPAGPKLVPAVRSALLDAPGIASKAQAGTLGRGEQDLLVRFESRLPGFGGLYIENGAVKVYMKSNAIPLAVVRNVLSTVYSRHPNPRVREAMANLAGATVVQGQYSLSELIAIQKRIEMSIPGWNGAGTNIMANRLVVTFPDSAALETGLAAMESAGVPSGAVTSFVMPSVRLSTVYFFSYVRPGRGGLLIALQNNSYEPPGIEQKNGIWIPIYYGTLCSLGFNVQATGGANYFMTAGHCENEWRGVNGITGDTVFQPNRVAPPAPTGIMGTIVLNPAWNEGANCPIDVNTGTNFDFCTPADIALGQYVTGASGERKIGTSVYGGINGNPGSSSINNWYPINSVLSPEYVDHTMHHEVAKSGGMTYTTSGPFVADMIDVPVLTCWPLNKNGCLGYKRVLLQNQTMVQADVSGGDSGSPVFTGSPGSGAPYGAMGIVSGGSIPPGQLPEYPCPTCRMTFSRWDMIEARLNMGVLSPETVF